MPLQGSFFVTNQWPPGQSLRDMETHCQSDLAGRKGEDCDSTPSIFFFKYFFVQSSFWNNLTHFFQFCDHHFFAIVTALHLFKRLPASRHCFMKHDSWPRVCNLWLLAALLWAWTRACHWCCSRWQYWRLRQSDANIL